MLGVMAIVFAGAMHLAYGFLVWLAKQLFVDTSDSIGLERWSNIFDLPQEAGSYTTGYVVFTGTDSHVVPAGTEIVNSDGYAYVTQAAYTIDVSDPVEVVAVEEGALYNSEDTTMTLSEPDDDIASTVIVSSGFNDGADEETTEEWVARLLARFQNPPSSGNAGDYERWAREAADEVGKAWCLPLYLGDGTVGVVVATSDLQGVSAQTVTDVADYIDTEKPIPADVYVYSAIPLDVDFEIAISPSNTDLQQSIEENIRETMLIEAGPGVDYTIPFTHITAAIAAAGPYDYEVLDIEIDGVSIGLTDIYTDTPNIPVFGSITFTAL